MLTGRVGPSLVVCLVDCQFKLTTGERELNAYMTTSFDGGLILSIDRSIQDGWMNGFVSMASSAGRNVMKCKPADCDSVCAMSPAVDDETVSAEQLVRWLQNRTTGQRMCEDVLIVDTRGLAQFNAGHVRDCVHVCGNKLVKRRLMQGKINVEELLGERSSLGTVAVLYGDEEDEFTELLATKMRPLFEETYKLTGERLVKYGSI